MLTPLYKILYQVFCTDSSQLVQDVFSHRDVHCGFDGGQGILKLGVTITDRADVEEGGRSHYSDVKIPNIFLLFRIIN